MNQTIRIGVGLIPGFDKAIANSYTTSTERGDFTKQAANTAGFNFNNPQPIILVIKKKRFRTQAAVQLVEITVHPRCYSQQVPAACR